MKLSEEVRNVYEGWYSKKWFEKLADRIEQLEQENQQLRNLLKAIQNICNGTAQEGLSDSINASMKNADLLQAIAELTMLDETD